MYITKTFSYFAADIDNDASNLVNPKPLKQREGYLGHKQFGNTYQYYPLVSEKEYGRSSIAGVIKNYFNDSYLSAVSSFVKEEKISVDELKELIDQIENSK